MAIFLELKANGDLIEGDVEEPSNMAGKINVQAMNWMYSRPASHGVISGKSQASGVDVTTNMGPHAVLIWKALTDGQEIDATFTFDASDDADKPELEVVLTKGRISTANFGISGHGPLPDSMFNFGISFPTITVTHSDTGMAHEDALHTR